MLIIVRLFPKKCRNAAMPWSDKNTAQNPLGQPRKHDVRLCKGLAQPRAVAVHTIPDRFPWHHEKLRSFVNIA